MGLGSGPVGTRSGQSWDVARAWHPHAWPGPESPTRRLCRIPAGRKFQSPANWLCNPGRSFLSWACFPIKEGCFHPRICPLIFREEGRGGGRNRCEREASIRCRLYSPQPGSEPVTLVCALIRKGTHAFWFTGGQCFYFPRQNPSAVTSQTVQGPRAWALQGDAWVGIHAQPRN